MNKTIIKMFACAAAGFAAGFGTGYLVLRNGFKQKINKTIEELEEEYQYAEKASKYRRDTTEVNPIDDLSDEEDLDLRDKVETSDLREIRNKLKRNWDVTTNYANMYRSSKADGEDPAESEHPEDDDPEEVAEERTRDDEKVEEAHELHQRTKFKDPKIISVEDLGDLPAHVEQLTLYYYTEDGQMVTENDELVDDPSLFIGDALNKYGFTDNDEKRIFVMNYSQDTVYEVEKIFGSFGDLEVD